MTRVDWSIVVLPELKSSMPSQSVIKSRGVINILLTSVRYGILFFFRPDFMDRALCEKARLVTYSMDLELGIFVQSFVSLRAWRGPKDAKLHSSPKIPTPLGCIPLASMLRSFNFWLFVRSRWLYIGLVLLAVLSTSTSSQPRKSQKQELGQYPAILAEQAWSILTHFLCYMS